ncbi:MAG: glycosyltransferase [Planctomycetia bacterium]|nr:glycosyltransferase [Planctomycetia bacterium]
MARVDVIIPCYNYGRFLEGSVESALRQEGVDVRVLIIDDASPDDTEVVGRRLEEQDTRVTYRRHTVNKGHIATYNEGLLEWADGDYALVLSADDMLTPSALLRAARLMDAHAKVGMTYGDVIRSATPDFASVPVPPAYAVEVIQGPAFIEASCRALSTGVETVTAVVRTSVQRAVGGYRKELPHAGDQEMWLRFASVSAIGRVKAPQGFYRRHGENMSNDYYSALGRRDFDQIRSAFGYFFAEFAIWLADRTRLEGLVQQELAIQAFYLANEAFNVGDRKQCAELLAEAVTLWPGVRHHRGWWQLQLKRAIGNRLWSYLRFLKCAGRRADAPTT